MLFKIINRFLYNDFTKEILENVDKNKKYITVFDVGCFVGDFSKNLKKKLNKYKTSFYLFDPNPDLELEKWKYFRLAFSDKKGFQNYNFNTFFPASGSSLSTVTKNDRLWNFTRRIITLNLSKKFITLKVQTDTLDNFCKKKNIFHINILKIDVEGSDFKFLNGAKKTLKKTDLIQFEILDEKKKFSSKLKRIKSFLKKYGFKLNKIENIWSLGTLSNMKAMTALFIKEK